MAGEASGMPYVMSRIMQCLRLHKAREQNNRQSQDRGQHWGDKAGGKLRL